MTHSDVTPQQQDTHDRLLATARRLFAERGYSGTSVRDITAAAGTNVGAVTYHFYSKQLLYMAVLQATVGPMWHMMDFDAKRPIPALDRIEMMVRSFFRHIRTHPEMPSIMVRELASGREIAAPIVQTFRKVLPVVRQVVVEGQQDGSIRAGDPTFLVLSLIAQPVYLNLARPVIQQATGIDIRDDDTYERLVEHAVTVIRAFLRNPDR